MLSQEKLRTGIAEVYEPFLEPSRYKAAYGGRGSGKSRVFARLMVAHCHKEPGTRALCVREVQKTLADSSKATIETEIKALGLDALFDVQRDRIMTPGDGVITFAGMNDQNAESVKSYEGYKYAWVEEAQTLSERSLSLLRPTIRAPGSEIWFSWNPTRKHDAVDMFFRPNPPDNSIVVQANWQDNPWWTPELELERRTELERYPERYPHTYEGEYAQAFKGAYFATQLLAAKREGRIGRVTADPLLPLRAYCDIGGAGANADAFVIWIVQWVGQEIRVLDYYGSVGQVLAAHVNWMRNRGYEGINVFLPHDGVNANNVTGKRYADHWKDAGFPTTVIPNQGRGAYAQRIEAVRRLMPKCWFNEATTEDGREALGFYHEKRDSTRDVGLGAEHDWSSHAADAFGMMCLDYREPGMLRSFNRKIEMPNLGFA